MSQIAEWIKLTDADLTWGAVSCGPRHQAALTIAFESKSQVSWPRGHVIFDIASEGFTPGVSFTFSTYGAST